MASDSQDFIPEEINLKYEDTLELTTDDECTGQRARRQVKGKLEEIDINVQKIVSKNKSESMYELRKLSHQQHPVSGFNKKDTFEEFLSSRQSFSRVNQSTSKSQNSTSTTTATAETAKVHDLSSPNHDTTLQQHANPPSSLEAEVAKSSSPSEPSDGLNVSQRVQQFNPPEEAAAQSFMPSDIRLDMQSLLERQIVHEVLQGPAEEIDRALREGMEERQARRRPRPRPRPHPQVPREEDGDDAGDEMGSGSNSRPVGRLLSRATHRGRSSRNRRVQFAPSIPTPDASGRYSVPRRDQSVIVERLRQSPALNSLGDEARDEIVAEVSGLVSRQLVTSALSGDFRGVLELHIQSRAQQANGGQLRPSYIIPSRRHDNDDDSNDREQLPSAQVRELHEEMMSIRGQLTELKQMMKLSFDLQLDIQQSIRQEVAAALSNALSQPNTNNESRRSPFTQYGPVAGSRSSQVVDSGRCVICSEGVIDSVIYHCGHMATCIACGLEMKSKALKCPICRAPITDVIRAYTSML